jgi:hypothetical protein
MLCRPSRRTLESCLGISRLPAALTDTVQRGFSNRLANGRPGKLTSGVALTTTSSNLG